MTDPPLTVADPLFTARLASVAELSRLPPETVVTLADPAVRLAVPPFTFTPASVTFDVSVPAVIVVVPVTLPPVRFVVPLESIEANDPLVAVRVPVTTVAPIVPPATVAEPLLIFKTPKVLSDPETVSKPLLVT